MKNEKSSAAVFKRWLLCLISLVFLSGCVVGVGVSTGGLPRNMGVEQHFTAGEILPDYRYYIQGSHGEPEAIIALRNSFQLQSRLWIAVDWTEKELKDAVFWMQTSENGFCTNDGGYLVTASGKDVGIWYSKRDFTTVKEVSVGVVEIYPFQFRGDSPCRRQHIMDQW